jgi:predicted TIM-barrel fold metal-dependent hydrolase
MKIDIFCHVFPRKYLNAVRKKAGSTYDFSLTEFMVSLHDMDARFRVMDKFPDIVQVLTITFPPAERIAGPEDAAELVRIGNDEIAELVLRHPDRFVAAIANLPMNDMDAALKEADRAIKELKFKGVQIYTSVNGEPLDLPKFKPLYEKMAGYDLPILIHPYRERSVPDYPTEDGSKYGLNSSLGYPFETSLAMARLVYGGILESYPNLKFVTHHGGGMVPYFIDRIKKFFESNEKRGKWQTPLTRSPVEYFRTFYNDTAVEGNTAALMCGHAFFGADRLLFGTDMPFDYEFGEWHNRETIRSIEEMSIPDSDKKKIYEDNAKKLLHLV